MASRCPAPAGLAWVAVARPPVHRLLPQDLLQCNRFDSAGALLPWPCPAASPLASGARVFGWAAGWAARRRRKRDPRSARRPTPLHHSPSSESSGHQLTGKWHLLLAQAVLAPTAHHAPQLFTSAMRHVCCTACQRNAAARRPPQAAIRSGRSPRLPARASRGCCNSRTHRPSHSLPVVHCEVKTRARQCLTQPPSPHIQRRLVQRPLRPAAAAAFQRACAAQTSRASRCGPFQQ